MLAQCWIQTDGLAFIEHLLCIHPLQEVTGNTIETYFVSTDFCFLIYKMRRWMKRCLTQLLALDVYDSVM